MSSNPTLLEIRLDQKQQENLEYFNYETDMITNDP